MAGVDDSGHRQFERVAIFRQLKPSARIFRQGFVVPKDAIGAPQGHSLGLCSAYGGAQALPDNFHLQTQTDLSSCPVYLDAVSVRR